MNVKLWLIGTCRLAIDDEPVELTGNKQLALLAYLATERGFHTREVLMALFWGDFSQERAMNNLRQSLHKLRALLPEGLIESNRLTVGIPADVLFWTDVGVVNMVATAETSTTQELESVATLINGQFMEGVNLVDAPEFDNWQFQKRHRVLDQGQAILERLITRAHASGDYPKAIRAAEQLIALEPLDASPRRLLMQLYIEYNQSHSAINQYHIFEEILERETGGEPDTQTQSLYQSIFERDTLPTALKQASTEVNITSIYPPRPTLTVGRDDDLAHILKRLENYPLVAIHGWPGVGKSTLVALLAHSPQTAERFPDGVLWTDAAHHASIARMLKRWGQTLGIVDDSANHDIVMDRLRYYLQDKRVLMIIDDVWNADIVHDLLIGGENCRLVITTRETDIARAVTHSSSEIYRLNILAHDDALAVLQQLAPDVVNVYHNEVEALITDLEGLPLALQVAGRLLQSEYEMGWGIKELLTALHEGSRLLQSQAPHDRFRNEKDNMSTSITALLTQSTDRLDNLYRLRFAALGIFAPKPATFSQRALAAIWQVDDPKETIRVLVGRGLMEANGDGRFVVHALLIAHARSLFEV